MHTHGVFVCLQPWKYYMPVLVKVIQKNKINRMHIYRQIYLKESTNMTVGTGEFEIFRASQQAGDPEKSWCFRYELEGSLEAEFLLPLGNFVFFLLRLLTDWARPTHIMDDNLLYSKSTYKMSVTSKKYQNAITATLDWYLNKYLSSIV